MTDRKAELTLKLNDDTQQNIITTTELCEQWWTVINGSLFENQLQSPIRFEIAPFRTRWGWILPWRRNCKVRRTRMGIHMNMPSMKKFLSVLTHEMVHQWEWEVKRLSWDTIYEHSSIFHHKVHEIKQITAIDVT